MPLCWLQSSPFTYPVWHVQPYCAVPGCRTCCLCSYCLGRYAATQRLLLQCGCCTCCCSCWGHGEIGCSSGPMAQVGPWFMCTIANKQRLGSQNRVTMQCCSCSRALPLRPATPEAASHLLAMHGTGQSAVFPSITQACSFCALSVCSWQLLHPALGSLGGV